MAGSESTEKPRSKLRWVWWTVAVLLVPVLLWAGWWTWGLTQPDPPPPPGAGATSTEEHPWVVAVALPERSDRPSAKECVGTLVEPDVVVTAAHCLGRASAPEVEVVAGRDDLRTDAGTTVGASALWVHPDRDGGDTRFPLRGVIRQVHWPPADIGVVFLEEELPHEPLPMAGASAGPAPGADPVEPPAGQAGTMAGYSIAPDDEPVLWQQPAPVIDDHVCAEHAGNASSPAPVVLHGVGYDRDAYLCAGRGEQTLRVIHTDSGSPLVLDGRLAGVMSWSVGERAGPEYFTRVATYADELQEVIDAGPEHSGTD